MHPQVPHLTPLTQSGQVSLLDPLHIPHGRVSNVSFHKAIYSWCSNTETAPAHASEKGAQQRNPQLLYPHRPSHMQTLLLLMSLRSCCVSQCPFTWLAPPKGWQFVASCHRLPLRAASTSAACKPSYCPTCIPQ